MALSPEQERDLLQLERAFVDFAGEAARFIPYLASKPQIADELDPHAQVDSEREYVLSLRRSAASHWEQIAALPAHGRLCDVVQRSTYYKRHAGSSILLPESSKQVDLHGERGVSRLKGGWFLLSTSRESPGWSYLQAIHLHAPLRSTVMGIARQLARELGAFLSREGVAMELDVTIMGLRIESENIHLDSDAWLHTLTYEERILREEQLGTNFDDESVTLRVSYDWPKRLRSDSESSIAPPSRGGEILDRLIPTLRLQKAGGVCVGHGYTRLANWNPFLVALGESHPRGTRRGDVTRIDRVDEEDLRELFRQVDRVFESGPDWFCRALRRFSRALEEQDAGDRLVDFTIALEGALLDDDKEQGKEAALKQCARALGEEPGEVARLYEARSRIVHGGAPDLDLELAASKAEVMCRNVLKWAIRQKGFLSSSKRRGWSDSK